MDVCNMNTHPLHIKIFVVHVSIWQMHLFSMFDDQIYSCFYITGYVIAHSNDESCRFNTMLNIQHKNLAKLYMQDTADLPEQMEFLRGKRFIVKVQLPISGFGELYHCSKNVYFLKLLNIFLQNNQPSNPLTRLKLCS